jgi:hypothetical protein
MHLLKNLIQRLRNQRLGLSLDGRDVVAADVAAAIGGLTEISQSGRSGAIQDSPAQNTFRIDIALALEDLDMPEAAAFIAPWSLLHVAVVSKYWSPLRVSICSRLLLP